MHMQPTSMHARTQVTPPDQTTRLFNRALAPLCCRELRRRATAAMPARACTLTGVLPTMSFRGWKYRWRSETTSLPGSLTSGVSRKAGRLAWRASLKSTRREASKGALDTLSWDSACPGAGVSLQNLQEVQASGP